MLLLMIILLFRVKSAAVTVDFTEFIMTQCQHSMLLCFVFSCCHPRVMMGPDQPEHGLGFCAHSRGIVLVA